MTALLGPDAVSPVRTHTQVPSTSAQFPEGYKFYSGHLDWDDDTVFAAPQFTFSVLRDPRERLASFYLYMLSRAKQMPEDQLELPHNIGLKRLLAGPPDDYFFAGDTQWQLFISDHYDNFYTGFFAARRLRERSDLKGLSGAERMARALANIDALPVHLYDVSEIERLEEDLENLIGQRPQLASRRDNVGTSGVGTKRWPSLIDMFDKSSNARRLERFVEDDLTLMSQIGA